MTKASASLFVRLLLLGSMGGAAKDIPMNLRVSMLASLAPHVPHNVLHTVVHNSPARPHDSPIQGNSLNFGSAIFRGLHSWVRA
jgi:hypothetical protein